ncbi:MAG: NAD(P)/FAD-dependent oxidoreductase [Candidatus ainarchaeum sp.]|nr:NAD(P)/FAD-dependent oxidoreductase [Candidatus ainarchaeum sp.]
MAKLHVVGAGPAGSIAALSALRNGDEVVVSEDHPVAGIPQNCSGLFSIDGLESLSRFVDYRKHVINRIHGADIFFDGSAFSVRRKSAVACVCDRSALDQSLASNAEREGARINYGERVNGHYHSDSIIGADGPLSHVALSHGFPKIRRYAATLQAKLPYRCDDAHAVQMFLSNARFPGFFAWVVPHDEYTAEFGVGVQLPHRAHDAWRRLLKLKGVSTGVRPRGAVIPLEARPKTALRAGRRTVLLAGDAAGQVKSTTGGGVIFGGNCAALAGKYHSQPLRYELEWRARYGVDLAFHGMLHGYLATRRDGELSALGIRLKKMNFDVYLSNHGHMDRPTRMLRPALVAHMVKNITGVA